eukprot:511281_1
MMTFTEYVSRLSTNTIVVLTVIVTLIGLIPIIIMLSNRQNEPNLSLDDVPSTPSDDLTYLPMTSAESSNSKSDSDPPILVDANSIVNIDDDKSNGVDHIHPNHDHQHHTTEDIEEKDVSDEDSNDNRCGICLSNLDDPTKTVTGECRHTYHTNCIKTWIKQKNTCPLCIREWKPKVLVAENLKAVLIKMLRKPPNKLKLSLKRAMELAGEFTERLKANKDLDDKGHFVADLSRSPDESELVKMLTEMFMKLKNSGNVDQSRIKNAVFNILNGCLDHMFPVQWQYQDVYGNWRDFLDLARERVERAYSQRHVENNPIVNVGGRSFVFNFQEMTETSMVDHRSTYGIRRRR